MFETYLKHIINRIYSGQQLDLQDLALYQARHSFDTRHSYRNDSQSQRFYDNQARQKHAKQLENERREQARKERRTRDDSEPPLLRSRQEDSMPPPRGLRRLASEGHTQENIPDITSSGVPRSRSRSRTPSRGSSRRGRSSSPA
jgi:hypothetical protein